MLAASCEEGAVIAATLRVLLQRDARGHLDSLAQAALADAAQAAELEAVGRHQQVLRHGHIQVCTLQLLCIKPSLQDYWTSNCQSFHLHGKQLLT